MITDTLSEAEQRHYCKVTSISWYFYYAYSCFGIMQESRIWTSNEQRGTPVIDYGKLKFHVPFDNQVHFRYALPSQSFSMVLKKLNPYNTTTFTNKQKYYKINTKTQSDLILHDI